MGGVGVRVDQLKGHLGGGKTGEKISFITVESTDRKRSHGKERKGDEGIYICAGLHMPP